MAKTTSSRGSDQHRAAAASDREHSEPSSTERARAINAARFGKCYTAALKAKRPTAPEAAAEQSSPATAAPSRPPITNKDLPNMSRQMSSRHQLPNGRSRTGFNTPAEVQEGKSSAFRKFPAKAHALELAAREARGVEKMDKPVSYQDGPEGEEVGEREVIEEKSGSQRPVTADGEEKDDEDDEESEYDSDA